MQLVPFEIWHLQEFSNYGGQEHLVSANNKQELEMMQNRGKALTAIIRGQVAACAGLFEVSRFRAVAWGMFQKRGTGDFAAIHCAVRKGLQENDYRRIEAYVDPKSFGAMRWIKLLGFKLETAYIPYYFPDGSGASSWVIYK